LNLPSAALPTDRFQHDSSTTTSAATALQLEGISRRIGARTILEDLDLTVSPGECLALLGPSGCGKSSTLRLISGLDSPDSGRILLGERDITALPPARRQVAMVFQSYALYPHLSVARNLSLGMEIRGVDAATIARDLDAVLELLQLGELRQRRPADLSGGQRQRVALARALLRRPQVFLLDEPMSNLDAQLREELRPQLRADPLRRWGRRWSTSPMTSKKRWASPIGSPCSMPAACSSAARLASSTTDPPRCSWPSSSVGPRSTCSKNPMAACWRCGPNTSMLCGKVDCRFGW